MVAAEKRRFAESLTILCLILLPLLCIPLRLIPGLYLRLVLFAVFASLCISLCLFGKIDKAGLSKVLGVIFLLPIILSASAIIVFPEKIMVGTEILSFKKNLLPTKAHILGTDYKGRDILLSLMSGGGHTYFISIIATLLSSFIGVVMGILMSLENKLFQIMFCN